MTADIRAGEAVRATRDGDAGTRVADGIRHAILAGGYRPGTRIRQEEIAHRYGASRVPVREALRTLEIEGLIRVVANSGAWVASLTLDECVEVYLMRERLEPLLLRYSAPHLSDEDLDELTRLAHEMTTAPDLGAFLELDRRFHLDVYRRASTSILGDMVEKLWNTTQPYRRAYSASIDDASLRVAHDEHHLIVVALREGDVQGAEEVLASHIRRTRREFERSPERFAPLFGHD